MPFPTFEFPQPPYERKRHSYDCKGRLLTIREGMTVVPYEQIKSGWYAVVVEATTEADRKSYPRGGYNIVVSDEDVETAIEREMKDVDDHS